MQWKLQQRLIIPSQAFARDVLQVANKEKFELPLFCDQFLSHRVVNSIQPPANLPSHIHASDGDSSNNTTSISISPTHQQRPTDDQM